MAASAWRSTGRWSVLLLGPLLGGCGVLHLGVLGAAGPIAAQQRHLLAIVGVVLGFVAAPVLLLTPAIAWHYRLSNRRSAFRPDWDFSWWLEGLIWLPPMAIVMGLAMLVWQSTHRLDPYRPLPSAQPPLEVEAVAYDWKWLFIYPQARIATVNRLVIPAGRPVHLRLTSMTVMQSLLVPRLAGQIYAMAGMVTQLNLAASTPGTFAGENTQYNGAGFPREHFTVAAVPPAAFAAWVAQTQRQSPPFDAQVGAALRARAVAAPATYRGVPGDMFDTLVAGFNPSAMRMIRP